MNRHRFRAAYGPRFYVGDLRDPRGTRSLCSQVIRTNPDGTYHAALHESVRPTQVEPSTKTTGIHATGHRRASARKR